MSRTATPKTQSITAPSYTTKGADYYTNKGAEYNSTAYAAPAFYTDRILRYNPRCPQLLYRGSQVLHHQGTRVFFTPKTTLSDLTTKRFLNARAEISIWVYIYLSVVFMVISHWELIVDLKWENKNFHTGNSFVVLLWQLQVRQHFGKCILVLDTFQGQYPALSYVLFHILEVTTALVTLHTDMF